MSWKNISFLLEIRRSTSRFNVIWSTSLALGAGKPARSQDNKLHHQSHSNHKGQVKADLLRQSVVTLTNNPHALRFPCGICQTCAKA